MLIERIIPNNLLFHIHFSESRPLQVFSSEDCNSHPAFLNREACRAIVQIVGPLFGRSFAQMEFTKMAGQLFEAGGTELAPAASVAFVNLELWM